MKRYKRLTTRIPQSDGGVIDVNNSMDERTDGKWIKWDDVKDAVNAYADWVERGLWPTHEFKSVECNCGKHLNSHNKALMSSADLAPYQKWICPAHGYKRL